MSETSDGRSNPFDLFGSPATQDDIDQGPDLSELMRQEAGKPPIREGRRGESAEPPAEPAMGPAPFQPATPERPAEQDQVEPSPVARHQVEPPLVDHREVEVALPEAPDAQGAPPAEEEDPIPAPALERPQPARPAPVAAVPPAVTPQRPDAPLRMRAPEVRAPEPIGGRKLWVLRILLMSNVAMMAMMLVLPHPLEPRTEYVPVEVGQDNGVTPRVPRAVPVDPYAPPVSRRGLALPDDALYERALMMALDGDFDGACSQLEQMLVVQPDMNPAVAQLVHAHLGYYLRKAGRLDEAIEHEALAWQQAGRSAMPEELLRSARAAETRGDGGAMRRAYAQFLLQEGQLSPEMRALVPEALLKLGDSYRVQAVSGEEATEERSR